MCASGGWFQFYFWLAKKNGATFFLQPANHSVATQGPSKHEISLDIQSNYCLQIL